MRLALFDLDHTLIPFDSGQAWFRFLIRHGHLEPSFDARYLAFCHQYAAGTLVIEDMMRLGLGVLARHPLDQLKGWQAAHAREQAPQLPSAARALVRAHQARGDRCVLVTATERFVAEVYARSLRLDDVVASEGARHPVAGVVSEAVFTADRESGFVVGPDAGLHIGGRTGRYTGEPFGVPCYGAGKCIRVAQWLAAQGLPAELVATARFYSDSVNDLPLLSAVAEPVVVTPDARLASHARLHSWPVADTLGAAWTVAQAQYGA